jgi:hypothetical protein
VASSVRNLKDVGIIDNDSEDDEEYYDNEEEVDESKKLAKNTVERTNLRRKLGKNSKQCQTPKCIARRKAQIEAKRREQALQRQAAREAADQRAAEKAKDEELVEEVAAATHFEPVASSSCIAPQVTCGVSSHPVCLKRNTGRYVSTENQSR